MLYYTQFETIFWPIVLVGNEDGLVALHMLTKEGKRNFTIAENWQRRDEMFAEAQEQVHEYLAGTREVFQLVLAPQGTEFQKKVWNVLRQIEYGCTATYGHIAEKIGNPKASRAVGMANSKNPLPLIIPCHRVVGANGKLTGYALGLEAKERLLNLEKSIS